MLKDAIQKGVYIQGLAALLNSGRPGFIGSWSEGTGDAGTGSQDLASRARRALSTPKLLTFYPDGQGQHPVAVLPYRQAMTSHMPMNGHEAISGEFTGCVMGVYQEDGRVEVNHVCTAQPAGPGTPLQAWDDTVGNPPPGFQLLNQDRTAGGVPAYLSNATNDRLRKYNGQFCILCIADPVSYAIKRAYVGKRNGVYKVLDIG